MLLELTNNIWSPIWKKQMFRVLFKRSHNDCSPIIAIFSNVCTFSFS